MSYTIQYLAHDGEWKASVWLREIVSHNAILRARSAGLWDSDSQYIESSAKVASELTSYYNVPIRTVYGDSLSPVSVYVNGCSVREAWVDRDMGHPHLPVTVLTT